MIGTVIEAADTAECFLIGITYDSDTNHQFIDHVLVGVASKVKEARHKGITFFSKLRFADVQLDCFPYLVPMFPRAARGAALEPFYGGRDTAHSTKSGTRATCTTSTVLHLGDLHVFHGHGLEQGMPIRAYSCNRKQSDCESSERISSNNFIVDDELRVNWTAQGHLVYAVILRMAGRTTWSEHLWRHPEWRLLHNLIPYHFLEICRMDNKTRPGRDQSTYVHPITYLCLHRHLVHNILKDTTRPASWPPYVGARETEYFAECQFEAKRRHGPPHGLGCSNWITSTHVNHRAQLENIAKQKEPGELLEAPKQSLSMEEKTRISNLAMQTAAKLFVLCCPRTMPQTVVNQSMTLTLRRYRNWCSAKQNVPMEEEGYQDADSEPESEKYDEDRAHMSNCPRGSRPDPSSGSLAPLTSERGSPGVHGFLGAWLHCRRSMARLRARGPSL